LFPPRHLAGHLDRHRHVRLSGCTMLGRLVVALLARGCRCRAREMPRSAGLTNRDLDDRRGPSAAPGWRREVSRIQRRVWRHVAAPPDRGTISRHSPRAVWIGGTGMASGGNTAFGIVSFTILPPLR